MRIESGQVAVVTGAGQGIGAAFAAELTARGVAVVLLDLAAEAVRRTASELGERAIAVTGDVSDPAVLTALAEQTLDRFGRVDLVINNAGVRGSGEPVWEMPAEQWDRVIGVNLLGVVNGIRAFVPHLIEAGSGHVVNVASLAGLSGAPRQSAYAASKHAVVAVSEILAAELSQVGAAVGVTVACPGFVDTPLVADLLAAPDAEPGSEIYESLARGLPAGRSVEEFLAQMRGLVDTAIPAPTAAERILRAVENDELYALPNGDLEDTARDRAQRVLNALGNRAE
ncbi:SDR family NAD(P)-dependent oxidoreductase [Allokutzneria sp. A3M-2-11 16]|uniref:SDR family oxidoreductase n=1 Tax=Allokutzneria sp. A3M-2-11 16 TaxID=2962043 RepID=UPI0020B8FFF9|nr:SDR family NAD(P)-dependent oxidoreductase [Allokutzneria sp. A3M-2-11 16]MCP3804678.1 SDR family NAD(P)-dependent oxidoreductase [Allokutzneria sp. A3M-2-11 16]